MNLLDVVAKNPRLCPDELGFVEERPVTKVKEEIFPLPSWFLPFRFP